MGEEEWGKRGEVRDNMGGRRTGRSMRAWKVGAEGWERGKERTLGVGNTGRGGEGGRRREEGGWRGVMLAGIDGGEKTRVAARGRWRQKVGGGHVG